MPTLNSKPEFGEIGFISNLNSSELRKMNRERVLLVELEEGPALVVT